MVYRDPEVVIPFQSWLEFCRNFSLELSWRVSASSFGFAFLLQDERLSVAEQIGGKGAQVAERVATLIQSKPRNYKLLDLLNMPKNSFIKRFPKKILEAEVAIFTARKMSDQESQGDFMLMNELKKFKEDFGSWLSCRMAHAMLRIRYYSGVSRHDVIVQKVTKASSKQSQRHPIVTQREDGSCSIDNGEVSFVELDHIWLPRYQDNLPYNFKEYEDPNASEKWWIVEYDTDKAPTDFLEFKFNENQMAENKWNLVVINKEIESTEDGEELWNLIYVKEKMAENDQNWLVMDYDKDRAPKHEDVSVMSYRRKLSEEVEDYIKLLIKWLQEQKKIVVKPEITEHLNYILEEERGERKRKIVKKMRSQKDFPKEFEPVKELLQKYEMDECPDDDDGGTYDELSALSEKVDEHCSKLIDWLKQNKERDVQNEFRQQLNKILANEEHKLKRKIVDKMEKHDGIQHATQLDVKTLFGNYKKTELKEDADNYKQMLFDWLKEKKANITRMKFRYQLDRILVKERGIRKRRIIDIMQSRNDIFEANDSSMKLFEQYKEDQICEDKYNWLIDDWKGFFESADEYSMTLISWLKNEEEMAIQAKFHQKLNEILSNERGIRKRKMVEELEDRNDVREARQYDMRLFENYKKEEFSEEFHIAILDSEDVSSDVGKYRNALIEWLKQKEKAVTQECFAEQLNKLLENETRMRKHMIVAKMQNHDDEAQTELDKLLENYKTQELTKDVDKYGNLLINWLQKEDTVTKSKFRLKLNKILAKERQVRKRKIVDELEKREELMEANHSMSALFENYKAEEFSMDCNDWIFDEWEKLSNKVDHYCNELFQNWETAKKLKVRYAFRRHLNGVLANEQGVYKCKIVDKIAKHNHKSGAFELFARYKAKDFSKDVNQYSKKFFDWLRKQKGKINGEEFQRKLNEILGQEGVIRKDKIAAEMESAEFLASTKDNFAKYRVVIFGEVVKFYSQKLISWLIGKEERIVEEEFRLQLNNILANEGRIRRSQIIAEMETKESITEVCESAPKFFDSYKKKELSEDVEHCSIALRCWLKGRKRPTQEDLQLKLDEILIEEERSRKLSIIEGVKENFIDSTERKLFEDYDDDKLYDGADYYINKLPELLKKTEMSDLHQQLEEMLSREGGVYRCKILNEMEKLADELELKESKLLLEKCIDDELRKDVEHYSSILIEWINEKDDDVIKMDFRHMLNKILAKEGQVRKSKIVNEMGERKDIAKVCRSSCDLFLNYKNDEFFHDVDKVGFLEKRTFSAKVHRYSKIWATSWDEVERNAVEVEFQKQMNKILAREGAMRKYKIVPEMEKRCEKLHKDESLKKLLQNYKKDELSEDDYDWLTADKKKFRKDVEKYSQTLRHWLKEKEEKAICNEFQKKLNKILANEKGLRKFKIVVEMAKQNYSPKAATFVQKLFDNYEKEEFHEDDDDWLEVEWKTFSNEVDDYHKKLDKWQNQRDAPLTQRDFRQQLNKILAKERGIRKWTIVDHLAKQKQSSIDKSFFDAYKKKDFSELVQQHIAEMIDWLGSIFRSVTFKSFRAHLDNTLDEESIENKHKIIDKISQDKNVLLSKQRLVRLFSDYKQEKFSEGLHHYSEVLLHWLGRQDMPLQKTSFCNELNKILSKECKSRKHKLVEELARNWDTFRHYDDIEGCFHYYKASELQKDVKKYSDELKKCNIGDPVAQEEELDRILNEESYHRKQKIIDAMAADTGLREDYVKRELRQKVQKYCKALKKWWNLQSNIVNSKALKDRLNTILSDESIESKHKIISEMVNTGECSMEQLSMLEKCIKEELAEDVQKYTNELEKWIGRNSDVEDSSRFGEKLSIVLSEESNERKHSIIIEMAKRDDLLGAHQMSRAFFEEYTLKNEE